jgi:spore coat assembly protein
VVILNINDIVTRKKYNNDILFIIIEIKDDIYYLEGVYVRLIADSNIDDLTLVNNDEFRNSEEQEVIYHNSLTKKIKKNNKYLYGKILHIDGDNKYLDKCQRLYNTIGIYAKCIYVKES